MISKITLVMGIVMGIMVASVASAQCTGVLKSGTLDAPTDKKVELTVASPSAKVGDVLFEVMYRSGQPYVMTITNTKIGIMAETAVPRGSQAAEDPFSVRLARSDNDENAAYIQCRTEAKATPSKHKVQ